MTTPLFGLAWRELWHDRRKLQVLLFVLFVGWMGPFVASAIRSSVQDYLATGAKRLLSADIAVTSLRPFDAKEIDWLKGAYAGERLAFETEFVTMARGSGVATLVEVKGVDGEFPIYGAFHFQNEDVPRSARALDTDEPLAWAYPEVLAQLGLKAGEKIGIGAIEFKLSAVLKDAPGVGRTGGFAPRVYIARRHIEGTGLSQYGAQVFHRAYLKLPAGESIDIAGVKIKNALRDPEITVRTPDDATQGFSRFFQFFNFYLVTVTMVVFVLSWGGGFYILQIYLQERLRNAAIYLVNGANRGSVVTLYTLQILAVIALAFVAAGVVAACGIQAAAVIFAERFPEGFVLRLAWSNVGTLALIAAISALAYTVPLAVRLRRLKLQNLLAENAVGPERLSRLTAVLVYVPPLAVFFALMVWMMGSAADAFRLGGGITAMAALGAVAGRACFRAFFASVRTRPGFLRLVAMSLTRSRWGVNLAFLSMMLVALALNLVPHLLNSVVAEIEPLEGRELPSLFLFNIPESALPRLKEFAGRSEVELRFLSPLVLGRLEKVNGRPTQIEQFQRFPVRLSYRAGLIPSERLVAGHEFSGRYDPAKNEIAEISLEKKFAERNQLKLGDVIDFDVQSLPVKARVVSLRQVRWTSFNPNFFIMFQPGVLDDAPKTWIANAHLDEARKVQTQYALTHEFPDLSVLDIGRTVTRVLEIIQSVVGPVRAAAWGAVLMSWLILIGIMVHNLRLRTREIEIEKLMGADAALIRRWITAEYAVIAVFAWSVGASSALLLAWVLAYRVLEIPLKTAVWAAGGSLLATVVAAALIANLSSRKILGLRGSFSRL